MVICRFTKTYLWRFLFLQGLLHDMELILCSRMTLGKSEKAMHNTYSTGIKPVKKVKSKLKKVERDNWLWSQKQQCA